MSEICTVAAMAVCYIILILSEKGGIRKTATATALLEYLSEQIADEDLGIFEIDDQPRLRQLFPNRVTTMRLPDLETVRLDDLADQETLAPLLDAVCDANASAIIVDTAGSVDGRILESFLKFDLEGAAADAGYKIAVLVPHSLEKASIVAASRTMERVTLALPSATIVRVHCDDGSKTQDLPSDVKKLLEAMRCNRLRLNHHRLLPRALAVIEATGSSPYRIASLPPREACSILEKGGLARAPARGVFTEPVFWQYKMKAEFDKLRLFYSAEDDVS